LKNELNLKTDKSNIENAGLGLFVVKNKNDNPNEPIFKKDEKIVEYNGDKITKQQLNQEYGNYTAPYAIELNQNTVIDSAGKRGIGSLINSGRNTYPNNCKFSIDNRNSKVNIKATRNIYAGNELYIPYGHSYKFNETTRYETKNYNQKKKR
jgi:SET domain-containing protein